MAQFQSTSVTGSLTVTGQVVAQTLNVQQVTSSIVYSSGSNIFGNSLANTQQFTGSVSVTGSLTVAGALSGTSGTFSSNLLANTRVLINSSDATKTPLLLDAEGNYSTSGNMTTGFAITNTSFGRALNMGVFESGAYGWIQSAYINNADTTFALSLQPRGGNVGIGTGTTSPSNILSIRQSNASTTTTIELTNTSTGNNTTKSAQLLFMLTDTVGTVKDAAYVRSVPENVNVIDAALTFATRSSDGFPTERMRITAGGNVGIGTTSPGKILEAAKAEANNQIILTESSDSGDDTALFYARRSRGTSLTSPTATQALNNMGGLAMGGFNGTSYAIGAKVKAITNQNWTTSAQGTNLIFETTSDNSTTLTERMRVTSNGLTFNGDTAAANALDDYEEGTWTPTLPNGGTISVVSDTSATYTKIGRKVTVSAYIDFSSIPNNSSNFHIGGLPFTIGALTINPYGAGSISYSGNAVTSDLGGPLGLPSSSILYFHFLTGTSSVLQNTTVVSKSLSLLIFTYTYFVS